MTEDEAKTKWCPFTRVGEQASGAAENRPDGSYNCIASGCMAWRWIELKADEAFGDAVAKAVVEIADTSTSKHKAAKHVMENRAKYGLPTKPFAGYCGAFGKIG